MQLIASGSVIDCLTTVLGSIPGVNGVFTERSVLSPKWTETEPSNTETGVFNTETDFENTETED